MSSLYPPQGWAHPASLTAGAAYASPTTQVAHGPAWPHTVVYGVPATPPAVTHLHHPGATYGSSPPAPLHVHKPLLMPTWGRSCPSPCAWLAMGLCAAIIVVVVLVTLVVNKSGHASSQSPPAPSAPYPPGTLEELRWSDEFVPCGADSSTCLNGLDLNNWSFEYGTSTDELQCYGDSSSNLMVIPNPSNSSDGILSMTVVYDPGHECTGTQGGTLGMTNYTSARINSNGKASFLWSGSPSTSMPVRIEARMRVPVGKSAVGLRPAFWMMPQSSEWGPWCDSGEVDIVEHGDFTIPKFSSTVVFNGSGAGSSGDASNACSYLAGYFSTNDSVTASANLTDATWHIYGVLWSSTSFQFFIDNTTYHTVMNTQWSAPAGGAPYAPFDVPFYLLLNVAVGYASEFPTYLTAAAPAQTVLQVDWVRVYDVFDAA